ncbi:MAG: CoA-binding protein [Epsilonproteobacteria bacterium]|nr:CoA-binding protein [Campylobacterota bacterium]
MNCEFPTINSDLEKIKEYLTKYKNIAIIGASPNPTKDSHKVTKYMIEAGYNVFPIYPKEEYILGQKVYRSLEEIDKEVDIVVIFRKPAALVDIAKKVIARGDVKVFWAQLGIVNNEAAQMVKDAGIEVVQNRCIKIDHNYLFNQKKEED